MPVNGFFRRYWLCLSILTCGLAVAFTAQSCASSRRGDASPLLIITSVSSSNLTAMGATISWNTNRPSDSQVEYGTTTNYGNATSIGTIQTNHSVNVFGLTQDTLYHYRVKSKDESGNLSTSGDQTFRTIRNGTPTPTPTPTPIPVPTPTPTPFPVGGVDEFTGPFPSWKRVTDYGANGTDNTDDTAAIQQGLDALSSGAIKTLYIPAGTYSINQTLRLRNNIYVNLIGEDPDFTTIRWDGASGGTMLLIDGVAYGRFNRLTFDGRSIARVAVDQSKSDSATPHFDTGNEYAEDVFKNVGFGIRAGDRDIGAAETSVVRCRFINNTIAGIATRNFNALDWWIWYSYFENCARGVTNDIPNERGAGNFNVYNSVFKGSTVADLSIRNTGGFAFRNNYSINSKAFYISPLGGAGNGAQTIFQGNTILDNTDGPAIIIGDDGPIFIYDNFIRSKVGATGPAIQFNVADVTAIGNTLTNSIDRGFVTECATPQTQGCRFINLDNRTVSRGEINASEPVIPFKYVPVQGRRRIEVTGATSAAIQQRIDEARQFCGQRPIVHLPAAEYQISSTVIVPANCDMQIVGDGGHSVLNWFGSGNGLGPGPVMTLQGPSRAILRDFRVRGGPASTASGIVIENADQPNSRVYMQEAFANITQQSGILVDGLDYTRVDLRSLVHQGSSGSSVKVVGGRDLGTRTNIVAGAAASNTLSYEATGTARLAVKDVWYETSTSSNRPGHTKLTGNGIITLELGRVFTIPTNAIPPSIDIQSYSGRATIIGLDLQDRINISGTGTGAILALGMQGRTANYFFPNSGASARAALVNSRWLDTSRGTLQVPNTGSFDYTFLRDMLTHTRGANLSNEYESFPSGITDVRMFRVYAENTFVGFHIKK